MMTVKKTSIVNATGYDPYVNLAAEELLLNRLAPDEAMLYLWQNQHTVVVGRNQNAWRECHVENLHSDSGRLARRLSGGGAVYHDLGNLNFTFLLSKQAYDLHRQLKVIVNAAREVGIQAEFSGRNDILAGGRKFSGNAFYHGQNSSYHHGTILVDVDMSRLANYLNVPSAKMTTKGVSSVQSRVVNLREFVPALSIPDMKLALIKSFVAEYGGGGEQYSLADFMDTTEFKDLHDKYSSWDFRFGKSPHFDTTYETRFPWGGIEIGLAVTGGVVKAARIYSDAMESGSIELMADSLLGCHFERAHLALRLQEISRLHNSPLVAEVATWLKNEA